MDVSLDTLSEASISDGGLGQYELIRKIGRGGMGTVYLGRDLRLALHGSL